MIYLVTGQGQLFKDDEFVLISAEEALKKMESWKLYQFDTETSGRNPHICDLLCAQFGYDATDERIVVDCSTVDIRKFKMFIESRYMIGQNLKFDLQFLYKYDIIPRKVYDTMIVEQMLYLGYPTGQLEHWQEMQYYRMGFPGKLQFSLKEIAKRYLGIDIDKTVRGEIIWRGLDASVIRYAAGDVTYLQQIMKKQREKLIQRNCIVGAKLECDAVPAMAYMEWCGIKLDIEKWKLKMKRDLNNLNDSIETLNKFILSVPELKKKFTEVDYQGNLFTGFNLEPQVKINWASSDQVVTVFRTLGFNTKVQDKKTGNDKESAMEKYLKKQKGINDEFLRLYFGKGEEGDEDYYPGYSGSAKVVSSFGQGHIDAVNPLTGRIHTSFKQIGAATGRMSCGGGKDEDLSKLKKIRRINYPNLQQLPKEALTRSCFIAEKGNKFVSCDFSAEESRLGADIYDDDEMRKEFTERTGDTHAMFAWAVFRKECEELGCTSALEVKKKAKHWRDKVKGVEFAYLFGAAAPTIAESAGCSVEQAQKYIDDLDSFFKGRTAFLKKGSAFVRKNGYVVISPVTGHRLNWWDWDYWVEKQKSYTPEFWEDYRMNHKGTDDEVARDVRVHFQAASKYDRYALNSPTQGTGAIVLKEAMRNLFDYIVDNGHFNKVKICVVVHDEVNCEYPEELTEFPSILAGIMKDSAAKFCKSLPIPAEPEVGDFWIH